MLWKGGRTVEMKTSFVQTNKGVIEYFYSKGDSVPIVLLAGIGGSLYEWWDVIEEHLTVLTYNRSGYGQSEWSEHERTLKIASEELDSLLQTLGIESKVILAGHSYGGLIAQDFAVRYPERIEGVVLIDATSMNIHRIDEIENSDETSTNEYWIEKCEKYSKLTSELLIKELELELLPKYKEWESHMQEALMNHETSPSLYRAVGSEIQHMGSCARLLKGEWFPDAPLIVIGRDPIHSSLQQIQAGLPELEAIAIEDIWSELIKEQTQLSKNATFIQAEGAGHNIPYDCPELIIQAMKQLTRIR